MSEALYRKYRPQVFNDMVGQEHIERTIKNAIEQDKVSHAYLFTGPRGTGKTTTARLLAKALMCQQGPTATPDGTCQDCIDIAASEHPDVYELDAASRTGVDNVREEIIGRVQYAPTRGRYKVYIIDEVHMLSNAAFNALLKTLEEPPAHVVFILCTTDPHRVPETIHSRCQRFDFHRISIESIVSRLGYVCESEGVSFEGEALELVAHRAEGGMRNALTALEQIIAFNEGQVTLESAERLLGSLDSDSMAEIVAAIGQRDASACFNWTASYVETGADLAQFVRDLAEHVRDLYIMSLAGTDVDLPVEDANRQIMSRELEWFGPDRLSRMMGVLGDLNRDLRVSTNPRLAFEIALTRMIRPESDLTIEALSERVEQLERAVASGSPVTAPSAFAAKLEPVSASSPARTAMPAPASALAPAATPASAPAPAPAAMPAPAPAPTPVPDSVSEPAPTQTPIAAPVPIPAPAEASAAMHAPAATAAPEPIPASAPGSIPASAPVRNQASAAPSNGAGFANVAALQRFWRNVIARIRKDNPPRAVLFLTVKPALSADGNGLVLTFAADAAFAYNVASQDEVKSLLSSVMAEVAGRAVPFELTLEAAAPGASTQMPSSVAQPSSAPSMASTPQEASVPLAHAPFPQSLASQTPPTRQSASMQTPAAQIASAQPPALQSAPAQAPAAPTTAAQPPVAQTMPARPSASQPQPAATQSRPLQPATVQPAAVQPRPQPQPQQDDFSDDRPPLDMYDEMAAWQPDAPMAPQAAAKPSAASAPAASAPASPVPAASAPASPAPARQTSSNRPPTSEVPALSDPASASSAHTTSAAAASAPTSAPTAQDPQGMQDERQRVKDTLTSVFGHGIRFEDVN